MSRNEAIPSDAPQNRWMDNILGIPVPPPNNMAHLYGYGTGEDFEPDVNSINPDPTAPVIRPSTPFPVPGALPTLPPREPTVNDSALAPPPSPTRRSAKPAARTGGRKTRTKFTPRELEQAARVTIEVDPFSAKHGEKGTAWVEVCDRLKAMGLCLNSPAESVKNKVMALLAYQRVCTAFPCSSYLC